MNVFAKVRSFYKETVSELKKATWPGFAELRGSTAVVVTGVFILGLFITVSDFSLSNWIEFATEVIRAN